MKKGYHNYAAEALRANKKISAAWLQAVSPIVSEIMAEAGFDVLLIDMEHGPGDILALISQIQAMKEENAVPFVRATWNDFVLIKRILDTGVYGLIIPYVSTKAEAEAAVQAAKYPPEGIRGMAGSPRAGHYGYNSKDYYESANKEIFVFVQIETPGGVKNINDILSVPGIDGIFIGPMDLATTHGFPGQIGVPQMEEIILSLEKKVKASGKALATISLSFEDAKAKYDRGYNMVTLMNDTMNLGNLARELVGKFRKQVLGK